MVLSRIRKHCVAWDFRLQMHFTVKALQLVYVIIASYLTSAKPLNHEKK
jgi:hypothetical protein